MASGGPYTYINITDSLLTLARHDQTGVRVVRPGDGFNGPAHYDKYVSQGLLARVSSETVQMTQVVLETDLIPYTSDYAATYNGAYWELPPARFQRLAVPVGSGQGEDQYGMSTEVSALGKPKVSLRFALDARPDDTMWVTYYFYTSSINPHEATFKITRPEVIGENWQYPRLEALPSNFYELPPQDQHKALVQLLV